MLFVEESSRPCRFSSKVASLLRTSEVVERLSLSIATCSGLDDEGSYVAASSSRSLKRCRCAENHGFFLSFFLSFSLLSLFLSFFPFFLAMLFLR